MTPKAVNAIREPREFLHVELPVSSKDLLRRLAYETRVPVTQILLRLLGRAKETGVLVDWIKAGPVPTPAEEATAATAP